MDLKAVLSWGLCASVTLTVTTGARAQAGAKTKNPDFTLLAAFVSGNYRDHSTNEAKERSEESGGVKLAGSELGLSGFYKAFEGGLGLRSFSPAADWWSRRSELSLTAAYQYPGFPWIQPVLGYQSITQAGDRSAEEAPPAFIKNNTAAIFGLKTKFPVWSFATHGIFGQAYAWNLSSLEKSRNFGDEMYAGLGYYFATGRFRASLVGGHLRNFFNAEVEDPDNADKMLMVRSVYWANRIGILVEY